LPLEAIDINPHQSRQAFNETTLDELAESIRQRDVLQPIGVRRVGERYEILFGERRFRASGIAGKLDIPAVIYEDLSDTDAAILTALENLQREDLDIEDEARQFAYLQSLTGLSQRKLGRMLGKERQYISRRIRLLKRPELLQEYRSGLKTLHQVLSIVSLEQDDSAGDDGDSAENGSAGPTLATRHLESQESIEGAGTIGDTEGTETIGENGSAGPASDFDLVERDDLGGFVVSRRFLARPAGLSGSGMRGSIKFRWRPVQQFHNWVDRARILEVPPDERATLKVQLTEIKEALEKQIAQLELMGDEQQSPPAAQADPVEPDKANDPNSGPEHAG
jgi:ParB/RepB/Spo0J family partition protein